MNVLLWILVVSSVIATATAIVIFVRIRNDGIRLKKQLEMLDAMKSAAAKTLAAAIARDCESAELHDAEFWAIRAELELMLKEDK